MFLWGEAEALWTEAVLGLLRRRRQRRHLAAAAVALVAETEAWLSTFRDHPDAAGPADLLG